jgi:hypothetical protein
MNRNATIGVIVLFAVILLVILGNILYSRSQNRKCAKCGGPMKMEYRQIRAATTEEVGQAEKIYTCERCGAKEVEEVTIPLRELRERKY